MFHHLDFGGLVICYTWLSIELITVEIISVAIFSRFSCKMTELHTVFTVCKIMGTVEPVDRDSAIKNDSLLSVQHSMGQIIRSPVSSLSVCLSVCVSALSRSQFLTDFDEIWHRRLEPNAKETFRSGSISNKSIPYFYSILAQIGTFIMHFQWEC